MADDAWRLYEPPPHLFQIPDTASNEIKDIVEAFGAHCTAIHQSAHQDQPSDITPPHLITDTDTDESELIPGAWIPHEEDAELNGVLTHTSMSKAREKLNAWVSTSTQSMARLLYSRSLSRAMGRRAPVATRVEQETVECNSCFEDGPIKSLAHLSCQHVYCKDCLVRLILNAMSSESQWPPQCCRIELPRSMILVHLSHDQVKQFSEKEAEYGTPAKERWYCTRPRCGRWFKPRSLGTHVACPHCNLKMCPHCRGPRHDSKTECTQDKNLAALKKEANLEGWVSCPQCRALIELNQGCRHLTCLCKHQFCWVCSARWRTCHCTEDGKDRKLAEIKARKDEKHKREAEVAAAKQKADARLERERTEREARVLEEKAFAESFERARVEAIDMHFASLGRELDELHTQQCMQIIEARQMEEDAIQDRLEAMSMLAETVLPSLRHLNIASYDHTHVEQDLQERIRSGQQVADRQKQTLTERYVAEAHWIELAATERNILLDDAREYLLASGGDAPGTAYPGHTSDVDVSEWVQDTSSASNTPEFGEPGPSTLRSWRVTNLSESPRGGEGGGGVAVSR